MLYNKATLKLKQRRGFMNSQQYNRANKRVFLAVIIVFAYIAFTLFAAVGTKMLILPG